MTKAITTKDTPIQSSTPPAPMSKQAMYMKIAHKADYLIDKLLEECESKNPSTRIAALRTLINKILPDLEESDIKSDGERIFIPLIKVNEIRRDNSDN